MSRLSDFENRFSELSNERWFKDIVIVYDYVLDNDGCCEAGYPTAISELLEDYAKLCGVRVYDE